MSETITNPMEMDKDQLAEYAKEQHGVTFTAQEMRMGIDKLRKRVAEMDSKKAEQEPPVEDEAAEPMPDSEPAEVEVTSSDEVTDEVVVEKALPLGRYVQNPVTGAIFSATGKMAREHPDWPACDENGKSL